MMRMAHQGIPLSDQSKCLPRVNKERAFYEKNKIILNIDKIK